MDALTEVALLDVWEAGLGRNRVWRALALAMAGGADPSTAADLSIGSREAFTLALRERCFGRTLPCAITCPACAAELELELAVSDVRADRSVGPGRTVVDGIEVEFRPITSRDLLAIRSDQPDARRKLLARCVTNATKDGRLISAEELPDAVLERIATELPALDPQADAQVELDCADCGHAWRSPFDITAYLWQEIDAYARRLVHDVGTLASAYGWSENEVLAISPTRRQCYLEMAET